MQSFSYLSHEQALDDLPSLYNVDFVRTFGESIVKGENNIDHVQNMPEHAKKFCVPTNPNVSVLYGPRIKAQRKAVLQELRTNPHSRRAYINILYPGDKAMWEMDDCADLEFACSTGYQLYIVSGLLCIIVNMRSSNIRLLPIDLCNAIAVQESFAEELGLKLGQQIFMLNNLHRFVK